MQIACITNNVANAITRLDTDANNNVSEDILKGLDENDHVHSKYMHLTKGLSQSSQENIDTGTSPGVHFVYF